MLKEQYLYDLYFARKIRKTKYGVIACPVVAKCSNEFNGAGCMSLYVALAGCDMSYECFDRYRL